ncbi:hypothetical protein [uncultured Arthrobacter sp.]|uniref:hypothetical protein n=1 Tax=uncultured Arthrobacter sp. TaxID=114050 RepID=UPI002622F7C1|nr:hypothetical protein [uncultured Arthrobacter sp.]
MKPALILSSVLLSATLSACGSSSPVGKYEQAISSIDGVAEVSVDYASHGGVGDSADIEIVADTNDSTELQRVLDDSLRAFIESTVTGDETSLNYVVYSQDRSTFLTPGDLGTVLRTLGDIRRHYGLS